jgi:hypothetical protein
MAMIRICDSCNSDIDVRVETLYTESYNGKGSDQYTSTIEYDLCDKCFRTIIRETKKCLFELNPEECVVFDKYINEVIIKNVKNNMINRRKNA